MQRQILLSLVDSLPTTNNKITSLNEIKTIVCSLSNVELFELTTVIAFDVLFHCFFSTSSDEVELACNIIDQLLRVMEPTVVLNRFHNMLLQGLQSSSSQILNLCLHQVRKGHLELLYPLLSKVLRIISVNSYQLVASSNMLPQIINLIGEPGLDVAKKAAQIILSIARLSENEDILFQPKIVEQLQLVADKNDIARFRIFELVVDMAAMNVNLLTGCHRTLLLRQLFDSIQSDDILAKLNCLELLNHLTCTPHGLYYVEQQGIRTMLENQLRNIDNDPVGNLQLPGLIKFFGNVAHFHPYELHDKLQPFIHKVFEIVHDDNVSLKIVAIETVAYVSSTASGKHALSVQTESMQKICNVMGQMITTGREEDRTRVLESIAIMLYLEPADQTLQLLQLTEKWFDSLLNQPLQVILYIAKQPFQGLHCAALRIIKSLALMPWGQMRLNNHPGFVEYLQDRTTEAFKEGKECKYDIIAALVQSSSSAEIFGNVYYTKFHQYYLEGPFYVPSQSAVAIEGAD